MEARDMMVNKYLALFLGVVVSVTALQAQVDPNFHCYLLFGQSNMAGGGAGVSLGGSGSGTLNSADCDTSPRVKVLAFTTCNAGSIVACKNSPQGRTADKWYTASPALHICDEGVSPGDWFAKTMLDSIRSDIKIGLIPCALSGQGLQVFVKGGSNFNIPTWAHPTLGNSSPYTWMLNRCKIAQQTGVIKGILLHQGESGSGSKSWGDVAKQIIDDLKKDLALPSNIPVIVGELRQDSKACCAGGNTAIDAFAKSYPNCGLASSQNLSVQTDDPYHFNPEGMRELGKRYARAFLGLADRQYMPRIGDVAVNNPQRSTMLSAAKLRSLNNDIQMYTIDGKRIPRNQITKDLSGAAQSGNVYLVSGKAGQHTQLMLLNP
jgi:hypothetical protein